MGVPPPLGPDPRVREPGLLNGAVLSRVGRSTAVALVGAASGGRTIHMLRHVDAAVAVVAMSRTADAGLDEAAATLGIDIMFAKDTKHRQTLLAAAGILAPMAPQVKNVVDELEKIQWPHDVLEDSAPIVFQNAPFNKIFGDLVYVVATPSEHGCTCGPYMMYKQCEHVVYAESLDVAFRASTRDFATLLAKQQRGRPRGRVVPARDRRAANMSRQLRMMGVRCEERRPKNRARIHAAWPNAALATCRVARLLTHRCVCPCCHPRCDGKYG